jgi:hypothetical protein
MSEFNGPIPGQSLTTTPKNFAWERPPEISDPEEAIKMHLTRLSQPEMLDAVLTAIEIQDLDIKTVTTGILRGAVSNGIHSIDVGMMVAPVIHEFIKQATQAMGIEADDGFVDKKAKAQEREAIIAAKARKQLAKMGVKPAEIAKAAEAPVAPPQAAPQAAPMAAPMEAPVEAPKGLMARGEM